MNTTSYENQLKELCISFIQYMETLKRKKLITEEEYRAHIKLKKQFVDDMNRATDYTVIT